jgi:2-octaprenyl-6-methoxyphenol hydroxylase
MNSSKSVAIVGGGPAGMALALALQQHGVEAEIFEARERSLVRRDARILALSDGARQILDWLGVWQNLPATAIKTIHVSHRGGLGRTRMRAAELKVPALGWVLPANHLIAALDGAITAAGITYRDQQKVDAGDTANLAEKFALTAWAEGAVDADVAKQRDYGQHAVLCTAGVVESHENVAWERFTADGPVALLPLGTEYAVVLTCAEEDVPSVLAMNDSTFRELLQQRFGSRHRFTTVTPRVAYPLGLRYRESPIGDRQVWLGNAAQTLHPVAGQGFNLALRDIWELARQLGRADDPGDAAVLSAYAKGRRVDRHGAIGFTNLLIDSFASDFGPLRHLRGAGLLTLDLLPPLRNFVARRMIFGARAW